MVRTLQLATIGAFGISYSSQRIMGPSHAAARSGHLSLRNSHNFTRIPRLGGLSAPDRRQDSRLFTRSEGKPIRPSASARIGRREQEPVSRIPVPDKERLSQLVTPSGLTTSDFSRCSASCGSAAPGGTCTSAMASGPRPMCGFGNRPSRVSGTRSRLRADRQRSLGFPGRPRSDRSGCAQSQSHNRHKGYDGDGVRDSLLIKDVLPAIPPKANRRNPPACDYRPYRDRIERMFSKIKQFRRTATRYDKTTLSFLSFLTTAAVKLWVPNLCQQSLVLWDISVDEVSLSPGSGVSGDEDWLAACRAPDRERLRPQRAKRR